MVYGARKFYEMAVNLALSVKLNDPDRPITLLFKNGDSSPDDLAIYFDRCLPIPNADTYPGATIKLGVYEPSPYDENFYVDADCLIMKRDMDRHWSKYGVQDFAISGDKKTSGTAFGCDVLEMMSAADVDYMIDANCGIVFFRKGEHAEKVFVDARTYMADRDPALIELRPRRGDGVSDQPYFSAAMAKSKIEPISYTANEGTIMATTWRAKDIEFDISSNQSRLKKPIGFRVLNRFWAKGWVQHETSIAHFIELKPQSLYQSQSDWLRDHFNVPRFQFD